jgi:ATP-binding cassette subfamily B protein
MSKYRNGTEKVTMKEALGYTWRGIKTEHSLLPGDMILNCVVNVLRVISPMLTIFFSSLVISELARYERDINRIILFVSITVGQVFLFRLVTSIIDFVRTRLGEGTTWERREILFCRNFCELEYPQTEDAEVNGLRADIVAKSQSSGMGLHRLSWNVPQLFGNVITIISAAVLLSGMFFVASGDTFATSNTALIILLVCSVIIPSVVSVLFEKHILKLMQTFYNRLARDNRMSQYYNWNFLYKNQGGMDIRIYTLQSPILRAVKTMQNWFRHGYGETNCVSSGVSHAIGAVFMVLAYLVIGLRALEGMYDIGEVTRFVGAVTAFSGAVSGIVIQLSLMRENAPYLAMTFQYLDLPKSRDFGNKPVENRPAGDYELEFRNVSFRYPGSEKFALKNINLKFVPNERLAIVGMNGSGKTTMIKLLCRLFEPTEGEITLNGISISEYNYDDYIALFSVVFQDFAYSALKLGENVAISADYDSDRVIDALKKVGFGDRLEKLSSGLDTYLNKDADKDGEFLSGGEFQKIALARAVYKNAPIVILDEPTAALDPVAEFEVYSKFNEIIGKKTAMFISHRLSSCRFCHDIAVFHKGEIIERGSHDELLTKKDSKYSELWNAQAQHYS